MAETLLRVEARRRLLDLISGAADDETAVFYALPSDWHDRKVIYFGEVRGTSEIRAMTSGRKRRLDQFSIDIHCVVGPAGATDHEDDLTRDPGGFQPADEACLALVQIIDDALADDPRLVLSEPLDGGLVATVGGIDGPNPRLWTEGSGSEAKVTVNVESHLR